MKIMFLFDKFSRKRRRKRDRIKEKLGRKRSRDSDGSRSEFYFDLEDEVNDFGIPASDGEDASKNDTDDVISMPESLETDKKARSRSVDRLLIKKNIPERPAHLLERNLNPKLSARRVYDIYRKSSTLPATLPSHVSNTKTGASSLFKSVLSSRVKKKVLSLQDRYFKSSSFSYVGWERGVIMKCCAINGCLRIQLHVLF